MTRPLLILASTCLALAAFASTPALAAPPWSAPESVSSPTLFVDAPDVAADGRGGALATWRWQGPRPEGGTAPGGFRLAYKPPGSGEFGPEQDTFDLATSPVLYGATRAVLLEQRPRGSTPNRITLSARFGRSSGAFGAAREISTFTLAAGTPSLAASPRGDVLAAWIQSGSQGRRIVRVSLRRPGDRFSRPITLRGSGRSNDVVAAAGGNGELIVAWERAGRVEGRIRRAGHNWGAVRRIGPAQAASTQLRAIVSSPSGRAYVAWLAESAESAAVYAAVRPAGGARFRTAQVLDRYNRSAPPDQHPIALAIDTGREAVLGWTRWDGSAWRVALAGTTSAGQFGPGVPVSPASQDSILGDVATNLQGGQTLVVWSRIAPGGELGDQVQAIERASPVAPFGAVEIVSDLDRARIPAAALDPAGNAVSVWSQRIGPDTPGTPQAQITTFLRAAVRPPL